MSLDNLVGISLETIDMEKGGRSLNNKIINHPEKEKYPAFMPRHERLNYPGCIYHVIPRGIERRKIFRDNQNIGVFTYSTRV